MMKTKNEKRALLLAISNMGGSLQDAHCIQQLWEYMMQGLVESQLDDVSETVAEIVIKVEADSFLDMLNDMGISDDDPLPDYWAEVDAWLEENDVS